MASSRRILSIGLLVIALQLLPSRAADDGPRPWPDDLTWILEGGCFSSLWEDDSCATFVGRNGTRVSQGVFAVELRQEGELRVRRGSSLLVTRRDARLREEYQLVGPTAVYLTRDALRPLSAVMGERRGSHGPGPAAKPGERSPRPAQLGFPQLIAGSRGTRYRFVMRPQGQVFLWVTEGLVEVSWSDLSAGRAKLRAGEAIWVGEAELAGRRWSFVDAGEIEQRYAELVDEASRTTKSGDDVARRLEEFNASLAFMEPEAAAVAALELARTEMPPNAASYALFLARRKALLTGQPAVAGSLERALRAQFPSSPWAGLLPPLPTQGHQGGVGASHEDE